MNVTSQISAKLLTILKKSITDYKDIPSIKMGWHSLVFTLFSLINCKRLYHKETVNLENMVELKLMPQYLLGVYSENKSDLDLLANLAAAEPLNQLRQNILNEELTFKNGDISLSFGKIARDNMGSYYTPNDLASAIVAKVFNKKEVTENIKIADFSCGGGDFLIAVIDYIKIENSIAPEKIAECLYGVDIDPIALQNCIVQVLEFTTKDRWKKIISHFTFGNPLLINDDTKDDYEKNFLFATGRLYNVNLGVEESFFENKFDVILGNPPWEKIRFEERKFFSGIMDDIATISQKSSRNGAIDKLKENMPILFKWRNDVSSDYSKMKSVTYTHPCLKYSLAGEFNTYSMFTELALNMLTSDGCAGLLVKSTLVTAPVHKKLFAHLLSKKAIDSIFMFDNSQKIFSIDSREKFIVLIMKVSKKMSFSFCTGLKKAAELCSVAPINLTNEEILSINPSSNTIPNVNDNAEISFLKDIHSRLRSFADIYPDCHFGRLIHLTAHSKYIDKAPSSDNTPIYEGKFIEQYDGRYATFKGVEIDKKYAAKASAIKILVSDDGSKELPECRYFVQNDLWEKYIQQYPNEFSLCWRSLTSPTNKRTMISMILPTCPTCQSIQMLQTKQYVDLVMLLGLFNSIPFDYIVRIKMPGLDLTQSVIKQIPVPSVEDYHRLIAFNGYNASIQDHILSHIIFLLKTDDRLQPLCNKIHTVYTVDSISTTVAKKNLDTLFKEAYSLSDEEYRKIIKSFPKY